MSRRLALCCALLLAACAKPEPAPMKEEAPPPPPPPAPLTPADVAGKWAMKTMGATSDSVLVSYELVATATDSGWIFNFPGRKPVPVTVTTTGGDSILTAAGPYESVLRKGQKVTTNSVMRLKDGKLVGTATAHYSGGPDSVVMLRSEGTRMP